MPDGASAVRTAYIRTQRAVRARSRTQLEGLWRDATTDLSDSAMRQFTAAAGSLADDAQATTARATVAYLDALERIVTGRRAGTFNLAGADTKALRDVDTDTLWARPVVRVWRALSDGHPPPRAIGIGRARAVELLDTGLQLAHTRTAWAWMRTAPVESYRSSLNGPCGLCVLAATVTLGPDDPMPMHPHCGCVAWPRFEGLPAMRPAGEPTKAAARAAVLDLTGRSEVTTAAFNRYVAVVDHGEMGPMLRRRDDHFTGPSEIPNS